MNQQSEETRAAVATRVAKPHTTVKGYMLVFLWLCIFTAIEIALAEMHLPRNILAIGLIGTSIIKAALVAMFFMHLKFEGKLIYLLVIFPSIIAVVYILLLFPDIVIGYWE